MRGVGAGGCPTDFLTDRFVCPGAEGCDGYLGGIIMQTLGISKFRTSTDKLKNYSDNLISWWEATTFIPTHQSIKQF